MHGLQAALLFAAAAGPSSETRCPTPSQVEAELERRGENATWERLGHSEVTLTAGTMRVLLRDRTGATLGIREVAAPAECAERVSLVAVLLVAWAKTWDETALAPATRPVPVVPPHERELEVGVALGGSANGEASTPFAGLLAGLELRGPLGAALTVDVAGQRQAAIGPGAATYSVSRVGGGLSLRFGEASPWTDVALLPQLTRLSLAGKELATTHSATVWGVSLETRVRVGVRWRRLAPFVGLSVGRALIGERLTLDDRNVSTDLSPWDLRAEVGVSWLFGRR